jgi:prenyltransferase beta subunit
LFFRRESEVRNIFVRSAATGAVALAMLAGTTGSILAAPQAAAYTEATNKALTWIKTQQQADGSFAGFGAGSTVDAVLGIVAGGRDVSEYSQGGNTPVTFLESKASGLAATAGGAGKLLVAVDAIGGNARSFGGVDLVSAIKATYGISATGQYGADALGSAFAILGLHAAGEAVPAEAIAHLKSLQGPEGGWAFSGDTSTGSADTNTTAVVLQAMAAVGADKTEADSVSKAVAYLAAQQNSDGGWPYQQGSEFGSDSDVNSTSYVVQGLLALGNSAKAQEGQAFIAGLQNASGAFPFMKADPTDNAGATYQAIPALLGATFVEPLVAAGVPAPVSPPVGPGMPTTGTGFELGFLAALAALAGMMSAVGLVVRRLR